MPNIVEIKSNIITKKLYFQLSLPADVDLLVQSLNYVPYVYIAKLNDPIQSVTVPSPNYGSITTAPIDGTTVDPRDIIYVKLHNSKFLPEIELYCVDSKGVLFNDLYPFDHDTIVCIFVKTKSINERPIRMDFRVTDYETIKGSDDNKVFKYLIKGILNVDELHFSNYEARKGTSYNVIKDIATQMNLGFLSNVSSSNDNMTWINPSNTYKEFIKDITKYSYISDNSFVWTFIDFYYNMNYIDVQLALNEQFAKVDDTTNVQETRLFEMKNTELYLTNNMAFSTTPFYISKFSIINQSFKINLKKFYKMKGTWYVKGINTVIKQPLKELETLSSKEKLMQLSDKKSDIYNKNANDEYFIGKIDTDNEHKYYPLAKVSNKFNLDNLEKMKMVVILKQVNFSITRFTTILIEIYNPDDTFSRDADVKVPLNNINTRLTGYWFVTGINYIFTRSTGIEQEVTVMRRELNLTYDEKHGMRKYTTNQSNGVSPATANSSKSSYTGNLSGTSGTSGTSGNNTNNGNFGGKFASSKFPF